MMRLSDLQDKRIRDLDGKSLGRIHEVHAEKGQIVALVSGAGGLIERLTSRPGGHRIAWERVRKVTDKEVVVTP